MKSKVLENILNRTQKETIEKVDNWVMERAKETTMKTKYRIRKQTIGDAETITVQYKWFIWWRTIYYEWNKSPRYFDNVEEARTYILEQQKGKPNKSTKYIYIDEELSNL